MEIFLHLWDELDDLSAACRHMTFSAMDEVSQVSSAVGAALAAFAIWVIRIPG
jgi:hypothetical protein